MVRDEGMPWPQLQTTNYSYLANFASYKLINNDEILSFLTYSIHLIDIERRTYNSYNSQI